MTATARHWQDLSFEAGRVFTPASPIDERSLFSGREHQVRQIVDVIYQRGQHAILFGDRGVGKTSLANVLSSFLGNPTGSILAPRVNCDSTDTFDSVWRKVFEEIALSERVAVVGFGAAPQDRDVPASMLLGDQPVTPDTVRRALTLLSRSALPILIIDEFDRLPREPRRAFADTVKTLSDHSVGATVVLVGVADSVDQLVEEHHSVERALVQVQMPRMSHEEIVRIIRVGLDRLGMTVADLAESRIAKLSQGLPHYAHLLGLAAARTALDAHEMNVTPATVRSAISTAIGNSQQSVRTAYDFAVRSTRRDNLFADVLLSCAMAEKNELGYFAAQDVREPMRRVTGKRYEIPSFAKHLNEFCDEKRGHILHKDGTRRRFRYRFVNPLLQPFVIMRGVDGNRIDAAALD